MMKRLLMMVAAAMLSSVACAETFYVASGAADWSVKESYFMDAARTVPASSVPGADDTINVPAETYAFDSESASFATMAGVKRLRPSEGTVLDVTVGEGKSATLSAMIYMDETMQETMSDSVDAVKSTFVKRGAGTLELSQASPSYHTFDTSVDVQGGVLKLCQTGYYRGYFGNIAVADGATLWMPNAQAYLHSINVAEGGVVHGAFFQLLKVYSIANVPYVPSHVRGKLTGLVRIWTYGSIFLENEANEMTSGVIVEGGNGALNRPDNLRGVVYVKKFDRTGAISSLGTSGLLESDLGGGGFSFLGTEDSFDARITVSSTYPGFLDAGAGALAWSGLLYPNWADSRPVGVRRFFFLGTNAVESVFSGSVGSITADSVTYPMHLTKAGSGIWRFTGSNGHLGGVTVADGTLRYDSIAEKGYPSALGKATVLTADDAAAVAKGEYVNYAVTIGSTNIIGKPVFEYTGAATGVASTRPIVLAGAGGSVRASSAAGLDLTGVSARDAAATPTLMLDGASTAENVMRNVSDGATGAKVNVTKSGSGTWTLSGNLGFSGKLKVEDGRLNIRGAKDRSPVYKDFTWYRFSIAKLTGGQTGNLKMPTLGLFDKDGNNLCAGLPMAAGNLVENSALANPSIQRSIVAVAIGEGEVGYDKSMAGRSLEYADAATATAAETTLKTGNVTLKTSSGSPAWVTASSMISIIAHLPKGAGTVTHFDAKVQQYQGQYAPVRFKLEGSLNGDDWTELWSNLNAAEDRVPPVSGWNQWMAEGTSEDAHPYKEDFPFNCSATGTSVVEENFRWYRLSLAKRDAANSGYFQLGGIGLFDSKGNNVVTGLTMAPGNLVAYGSATDKRQVAAVEIAPGQVGYDRTAAGKVLQYYASGEKTAAEVATGAETTLRTIFSWQNESGSDLSPASGDKLTWVPLVFHLPDEAGVITHFDIQSVLYDGTKSRNLPVRFRMEASVDGRLWTEVWSNVETSDHIASLTSWSQWIAQGLAPAAAHPAGTGFTLTQSLPSQEAYQQLQNVSGVEVAPGAVLAAENGVTLSRLTVDAAGAGTMTNFTFAASGVLEVVNYMRSLGDLPGTYAGCTGFDNIANWQVVIDGRAKPAYKIEIVDGKLRLVKPGLTMIVR